MFPLCIPLIQNTGLSFVVAQNKHQFRSVVYLIIALANVISTYLIVPYMGIIGAALCSCVSYLLGQGLIMNIYYYRITGLDIPLFWKNILKMAVVPAAMFAAGLLLNHYITIDNWFTFLAGVMLFTAVYAVLMYLFAMNDYERDISRKPLQRILRVLCKR
jgi:O-antigen/teichoic acid export membrane protein